MKIIYLTCHSMVLRKDFVLDGCAAKAAKNFKKYSKHYQQECWFAINNIKKEKVWKKDGIVFRLFPAWTFNVPMESFFGIVFAPRLIDRLKKESENKDIIFHIQGERGLLDWQYLNVLKKNPVVMQFHGYRGIWFLRPFEKFIIETGEKYFYKFINHFFVHSKIKIDYLKRDCGIPLDKITYHNIGVDYDFFTPMDKLLVRKELNLPLDKNIIIHAGVFNKFKGIDKIIKAHQNIKEKYNTFLIVVGGFKSDPMYSYCKENADLVLERVPRLLMKKYLNAANVYCMICHQSRRLYAGLGIASIESLACNVPVLNSNIDDTPTEIKNKIGMVAESSSDLTEKLKYVFEHKNMFKNLHELSEPYFSADVIAKKTLKVYKEIIQEKLG